MVLRVPEGLVLKIPRGLVLKTNTVFVCRVAILGLIPFAFYSLFHTFAEMEKRAIIVGASSGIGREVALLLLAEGWHIGVAARREESLMELKAMGMEKDISVLILTVPASAAQNVLDAAVKTGRIDGVLNFSAAVLTAPPEVQIRDVDIFVELEKLLFRLKATEQKKKLRG